MIYTIYNPLGQITKTVVTNDINAQLQVNESYIEGCYRDDEFYIVSGQPVALPETPNLGYVFNYATATWIDPLNSDQRIEKNIQEVKKSRRILLLNSDWTQLPDVPQATKIAWVDYRQALRDITTKEGYPFNVIWPTKPE